MGPFDLPPMGVEELRVHTHVDVLIGVAPHLNVHFRSAPLTQTGPNRKWPYIVNNAQEEHHVCISLDTSEIYNF